LAQKHVQFWPVSSPPVLCADQTDAEGLSNQFGSNYKIRTPIIRGEDKFLTVLLSYQGKWSHLFSCRKRKLQEIIDKNAIH